MIRITLILSLIACVGCYTEHRFSDGSTMKSGAPSLWSPTATIYEHGNYTQSFGDNGPMNGFGRSAVSAAGYAIGQNNSDCDESDWLINNTNTNSNVNVAKGGAAHSAVTFPVQPSKPAKQPPKNDPREHRPCAD